MKLLSIAIPCYNSEDYMENCIKSLLPGGEDVEILIVDDGSKDMTPGSPMPMRKNIRRSSVRSIRKTADMEQPSMQALKMQPDCFLK